MKRETVKSLDEQRRIVAYLDGSQAKVNGLREAYALGAFWVMTELCEKIM